GPRGLAFDSAGNVYVTEASNRTVRRMTPGGVVTTLAGSTEQRGSQDGPGSAARFHNPIGAASDSLGNLYAADDFNHTIRKIIPDGEVTTMAEAESYLREGLTTFRRAVGDANPDVAFTLNGLADVLRKEGLPAEAETADREAPAIQVKLYDAKSFHLVNTINSLKDTLKQEGKPSEAETLSAEVQATRPVNVYGRQGRWREALAAAATLVELEPGEHLNYHYLAPLQAQVGDLAGYRKTCQRAVAHFREIKDPNTADRLAKDSFLLPEAGGDLLVAGAWAATAVSQGKDSGDLPWFHLIMSLGEYRQGHFAGAVDWAQKALSHAGDDLNRDVEACTVLAMAQHRSKQEEEAGASLAKGVELAEQRLPKLESGDLGDGWLDWLIAHILLREAQGLIGGQADLLSNQSK
ncbi:MAG: hypothetical protein NT154_12720, partial [Verrucomicrobia bacterium]|nr:hypothetical protein [Verrucomicrobiota bacterium]